MRLFFNVQNRKTCGVNYETRRQWSDRFNLQIKRAIGPVVLRDATPAEDMGSATDMVLTTKALRISCRVRQWSESHYRRFGGQFTLRTKTNGRSDELQKVRSGCVDMLFYGWGNPETVRLREWHMIDLRVFAEWVQQMEGNGRAHCASRGENPDGTGWSAWWIHLLPPQAVISSGVGLQLHEDSLCIA